MSEVVASLIYETSQAATPGLTAGAKPGGDPVPGEPVPGDPVPGDPVPGESEPAGPAAGCEPGPGSGAGVRGGLPFAVPDGDGLRFSFELDLVSALEAIGRPLRDWDGVDQEEDLAAEAAALGFADFLPEPADMPGFLPEPADIPGEPGPPGAGPDAAPSGPGAD